MTRHQVHPEVEIEVTARDIEEGFAWDPRMCPIARAARRALHAREVRVEGDIEWSVGGEVHRYAMPYEASQFIAEFDSGDTTVAPFTFTARHVGA